MVNLSARKSLFRGSYPRQFWLMFFGMLISTMGTSMVWPFLMIYVKEKLGLGLTATTSLNTINAMVGLASAFLAGPIIDRVGRKWVMVISLAGMALVYFFYPQAFSYAFFAVLMAGSGFFNPLYRVGGDAMLADLVPPAGRPDAYALLRMANNAGIAIGPVIGGFASAISYNVAFYGAVIGLSTYGVLMAVIGRETLPGKRKKDPTASTADAVEGPLQESFLKTLSGYLKIFADRTFILFLIAFTLNQVAAALIWVLLAEHAKHNFGLPESLYSFIPVTNAVMVVTLQSLVTGQTKKHRSLRVLALGSLIYAAAASSVALGRGFWSFWASMVVMTTGELMLMPTATTFVANLAPTDMRGRYMSLFGLTWSVAMGIGPLLGGILSDNVSLSAPWLMGGVSGLLASTTFLLLSKRKETQAAESAA